MRSKVKEVNKEKQEISNEAEFSLPNKKVFIKPVKRADWLPVEHEANFLYGDSGFSVCAPITSNGRIAQVLTAKEQKFFEDKSKSAEHGFDYDVSDLAVGKRENNVWKTGGYFDFELKNQVETLDLSNGRDYVFFKVLLANSDLVAKKSGVIKKLIVLRGTPKVKEGETVKKGQILISRKVEEIKEVKEVAKEEKELEEREIEIKEVKAAGIIQARVWYEGYGEAARVKTFTQSTSDIKKSIILKWKDKEIILSGPQKLPYNHFFVEENIKRVSEWRNINFPLEIITKKYIKLRKIKAERTIEEAKELAREKALESILQQLGKEVIIMNSNLKLIQTSEENMLRIKAVLEVEEDIATRRE